jgi:serine/threonine protein kinase
LYLSPDAKDLITRLLKKNPVQRLGSKGTDQIKTHRFFRKIDWDALKKGNIKPPFVPPAVDYAEIDKEVGVESPIAATPLSNSVEALFLGFSYVNVNTLTGKKWN